MGTRKNQFLNSMPEYRIWASMKQRCHNPRDQSYQYYGARGIVVCDQWRKSFKVFLGDVGLRPSPKLQLERINNNKGYEPKNVRWATCKEQTRNRRISCL